MGTLPILRWPDPRLSIRCAPAVMDGPALKLADDMLETMYAAEGRGLAAPQVGALTRVFVMDAGWKTGGPQPRVYFNPEILWRAAVTATGPEGCLSIPGVTTHVTRATEILLRWTAPDGERHVQRLRGFEAVCAQHEIDHLDGILTLDRLPPESRAKAEAEVLT